MVGAVTTTATGTGKGSGDDSSGMLMVANGQGWLVPSQQLQLALARAVVMTAAACLWVLGPYSLKASSH
ncbi:hypothetical protein ACE6H2_000829 [Prunus campanulata]